MRDRIKQLHAAGYRETAAILERLEECIVNDSWCVRSKAYCIANCVKCTAEYIKTGRMITEEEENNGN